MRWTLHHYHHPDQATAAQLDRIENMLGLIRETQIEQEELMAELDVQLAAIQDAQAATNDKLNAVKADVEKLVAAAAVIPVPVPADLTPEQQAALGDILNHTKAVNDGLGAIDTAANPPA